MGCSWYAVLEFFEYLDLCDSGVEDFQNLVSFPFPQVHFG